jgi:hypothetical protein
VPDEPLAPGTVATTPHATVTRQQVRNQAAAVDAAVPDFMSR